MDSMALGKCALRPADDLGWKTGILTGQENLINALKDTHSVGQVNPKMNATMQYKLIPQWKPIIR